MPPPSQPAGAMLNSLDLEGRPQDTRIVVAMSGGVDSSATAALLKSEGYDVVGITLQLYDHGAATHRKGACCAGQDIHDARNVAERIGIPHYVLDYENRFRESVIDNFADSYASGETPVPCIECNRSIKFRDLLKTARELGASALATGHYVASRRLSDGSRALTCAADADRDQSYFLFATTREQLDYLRFPLGDMTKPQARELARRFGLSVADKQDSQDICFVPTGRYTDIISRLRPNAIEPGDIVDLDGRVIGRHQGIVHFTVGQRRGLGIASSAPLLATARSTARSARVSRFSCACDRPGRRSRPGCARPTTVMKSNSSPAKRAFPPAKPACSTMRPRARRACSAADSSRVRPRRARRPESRRAAPSRSLRWSRPCADKFSGRGHGFRYRPRRGRKGL
jgi:tRNA-specific 2-thiouridylase